jgi:hypothetical protein
VLSTVKAIGLVGRRANEKGILMKKLIVLFLGSIGALFLVIVGAYWWSNTFPKRPPDVSANAVFLWAGSVGLPSPRRGNWVECWVDQIDKANVCRFTDMAGHVYYEGAFLPDRGNGLIPPHDLRIRSRFTSDWAPIVPVGNTYVPLLCLQNGRVLIPKENYLEGKQKLDQLRQLRQIRKKNGLETP